MKRRAFTLIELLVVVAIIAVLMSILLPAMKTAREQARDVVCRSNIGQVTRGFLFYVNEWRDFLPGFTPDNVDTGPDKRIFDWLGISSGSDPVRKMSTAPHSGTIYKYINNASVYRCPSHVIQRETVAPTVVEHVSSYTAPVILTGAPIRLLKSVRYPTLAMRRLRKVQKFEDCLQSMMAFLPVEEDSWLWLVRSTDSPWSNEDCYTLRHRGKAAMGFIDGHAELRKMPYEDEDRRLTAWHTIFELTDGRKVSAGHYRGIFMRDNWLMKKDSDF